VAVGQVSVQVMLHTDVRLGGRREKPGNLRKRNTLSEVGGMRQGLLPGLQMVK